MPELLCCHKDCPEHRDVEVPIEHIKYPINWYCYKHRGRNMFLPKLEPMPKSARPQNPPRPKERRDWA